MTDMSHDSDGPPRAAAAAYKILIGIAVALMAVILAGTAIAFTAAGAASKSGPKAAADAAPAASYFTGIGKIRAASAGKKPATIIVSIAFPYDRGDIAFTEELAARTKEFREIAKTYFGTRTAEEIKKATETELKDELKKRYNAVLRMGKIKALFFNDYLLID